MTSNVISFMQVLKLDKGNPFNEMTQKHYVLTVDNDPILNTVHAKEFEFVPLVIGVTPFYQQHFLTKCFQ